MLPMTLFETGDSCGEVSLASLFEGKPLSPTRRETGFKEVANWCCRGGNYPQIGTYAKVDDVLLGIVPQYVFAMQVVPVGLVEQVCLDFGRQCPADEDGDHGNKKNGARTRMCGRRWRCVSGEKCSC